MLMVRPSPDVAAIEKRIAFLRKKLVGGASLKYSEIETVKKEIEILSADLKKIKGDVLP